MGRTISKPLIKFEPNDPTMAHLKWYDVRKGEQYCGCILAAFELYLVGWLFIMKAQRHVNEIQLSQNIRSRSGVLRLGDTPAIINLGFPVKN